MAEVSIRELRNHGGEVVDRVQRGESLTITRSGTPVALLTGLRPAPLPLAEVVARRARLPLLDPAALRADLDQVTDSAV